MELCSKRSFPMDACVLRWKRCPAEHGVPAETEPQQEDGFFVRSKMPGASILCRVCRGFENGAFAGAVFAALEPQEAMERVFFVFQERLEILLGQRGKPPRGNRLFGQSSTYTQYTWETGRVYARHTFSDRFAPTATTVVRPAHPAATTPEVSGKKRLFRGRKPGVARLGTRHCRARGADVSGRPYLSGTGK